MSLTNTTTEVSSNFSPNEVPISSTLPKQTPSYEQPMTIGFHKGEPLGSFKVTHTLTLPPPSNLDNPNVIAAYETHLSLLTNQSQLHSLITLYERNTQQQTTHYRLRASKIVEYHEALHKLSEAKHKSNLYGWIGAGCSICAAVVATSGAAASAVASGGLTLPIAVPAITAITGATIATTMQVLNQTGTMDKMMKNLSKQLGKNGDIKAACIMTGVSVTIAMVLIATSYGANATGQVTSMTVQLEKANESVRHIVSFVQLGTSAMKADNTLNTGRASSEALEATADMKQLSGQLTKLRVAQETIVNTERTVLNLMQFSIKFATGITSDVSSSNKTIASNLRV